MGLSSEFENTTNPIEDDITDKPFEFQNGRQNELDLADCNRRTKMADNMTSFYDILRTRLLLADINGFN
jgi:hypothetical protein